MGNENLSAIEIDIHLRNLLTIFKNDCYKEVSAYKM